MSTSYIEFNNQGFWAKDFHLEELGCVIVEGGFPEWFPDTLSEHFIALSEEKLGMGCITLRLEEVCSNEQDKEKFKSFISNSKLSSLNEDKFRELLLQLLDGNLDESYDKSDYYWKNNN